MLGIMIPWVEAPYPIGLPVIDACKIRIVARLPRRRKNYISLRNPVRMPALHPTGTLSLVPGNGRNGPDSAVPDAEAQRPVSDSKAARCGRWLTTGTFGSALSHVRCYVPRNTTRASTAFTP
jgi:hypothetical protein